MSLIEPDAFKWINRVLTPKRRRQIPHLSLRIDELALTTVKILCSRDSLWFAPHLSLTLQVPLKHRLSRGGLTIDVEHWDPVNAEMQQYGSLDNGAKVVEAEAEAEVPGTIAQALCMKGNWVLWKM